MPGSRRKRRQGKKKRGLSLKNDWQYRRNKKEKDKKRKKQNDKLNDNNYHQRNLKKNKQLTMKEKRKIRMNKMMIKRQLEMMMKHLQNKRAQVRRMKTKMRASLMTRQNITNLGSFLKLL